ncbi:LOW QUALITY PROTEIN: U-box domain-containing protein 18 [Solanum tuberosum]|uniref:LOW QUALITY PROTEIN: U-box domain-containing protein 18 n=1 Tax=Solanum tuberosum TaxID=4113 RepID=UPI000739F80D|nr:PREDICTED: LOW QUALITY PROTEIN: U-box domain-containing protein 18 [Solanum tuberosum]
MINKSNEFIRRILNFPAIRPGETVCFSSLVSSLIQLGQTICEYKSRTFYTNKKNVRNSIRLIEDILIVLKEIPNGVSRFANSSIVSLSEIHFIFHKFHFLLDDCSREDSRIWILAKSEDVSCQFQMLARAVAVALDALPLKEMDVSVDGQEVVEFVKNQAVKLKFEVEMDDVRMQVNVLKILDQLEDGIVPESHDLKRVLDYLGIRLLTKTSIFNRSCLVEAGVIPPLLNLVTSRDSSCQENSMATLLNLSKNSKCKSTIVGNGGLFLILDVLKGGLKMEARQHAAGTLFYLTSVEEYRKMMGENPEFIPSLLELLRNGTDRGKKNALVTIFGLLMRPENHWRVIAAGLVPLVVNLLKSFEREDLITDSLAVLTTLSERLDGAMAVLYAGALPIIVNVLSSCNSRASKEYCVSLLLALCINGGADAVPVLVKNSSLMGPLYSLLAEGNSKASKKASTLIRILHEYNEKTSSGLITPVFIEDQFINVW